MSVVVSLWFYWFLSSCGFSRCVFVFGLSFLFCYCWFMEGTGVYDCGGGWGFGVVSGVVVRGNSAPRNVTPLVSCGFPCGIVMYNARLCG